jgi:hypothetical protein
MSSTNGTTYKEVSNHTVFLALKSVLDYFKGHQFSSFGNAGSVDIFLS